MEQPVVVYWTRMTQVYRRSVQCDSYDCEIKTQHSELWRKWVKSFWNWFTAFTLTEIDKNENSNRINLMDQFFLTDNVCLRIVIEWIDGNSICNEHFQHEMKLKYTLGFISAERVRRFNRAQPPPDVTREEWLSSFTQDSFAVSTEVGYTQRGSNFAELLEKQADLIRYLRDHNVKLSHRMMLLAAKRRATEPV